MIIGEFVLVRTYTAGVHCGVLVESNGTAVLLEAARRIWRWRGANSLHEMSLNGCAMEHTRISEPVDRILLTQATEILICTPKAKANLIRSRWSA